MRRVLRWALVGTLGLVALTVAWALLYRVAPVPGTPLMLIRAMGGSGMDRSWEPLDAISPHLARAVIASEDTAFCGHGGFDWTAIGTALEDNEEGKSLRGGSTISQQTAKNAFLWPARSWLRKGAEAWFTLLIESLWPKRRILEVYLNIVEWDDGVYGAEAAARHHFRKPAAALTRREAALLAVVLPSPRHWSPSSPGPYVARRAGIIERRMAVVERGGLADCAR
ncbi:monofunctional biosynthetic peptidoglycan transglycosylase [Azospirillum doebereinerae]|uniref:Biosynthetic peptidoglycan transglycosylase n=1 Tax=Azospirillum doebereinerae TaxID=92933 RepID=A0A433JBU3_9PROT|nr:monofunctional biosynthetic peptidoglycan transglycosylase [Azospirillum doebereinerae]MCG5239340.1 monofunctional biosynthetic peptidoglycan transglycosylase [Azospirillum doebereinerae]RUQ74029.1 monofunctional biosynthetic peptidoglycan transglycosylase [Azospirillum doebereinerae]